MTRLDEVVIIVFEVLGILLLAAGAGASSAWLIGWGGLAVSGAVLLAAASLAVRGQHVAQRAQRQSQAGVRQ